ncbi:MAG: DUF551 domain-containing protein [Spirochaetia bacterium]|nr:DUF551 domain-containing protein [Spirochaetia bacterium]
MSHEKESFEQSYENESEKNIAYWQNHFGEACYLNGFVNWLKSLLTWIPVEERLPECDGYYMIIIAEEEDDQEDMVKVPAFYHEKKKDWYDAADLFSENPIDPAWVKFWFDHSVLKMRDRV